MTRIPFPSNYQILETLLHICEKEKISIKWDKISEIIEKSDNKINHAIWLLEMYKYGISYGKNWENVIDNIINIILEMNINNNKKLYSIMKKFRELFYILFITNISTQTIIRKIMIKLINKVDNIKLKYNIIDITSIFEQRLSQGTRHIIHMEAYVARLIYLFTTYNKSNNNEYNLDVLEI
jgi:replication factor C subunit 3/5